MEMSCIKFLYQFCFIFKTKWTFTPSKRESENENLFDVWFFSLMSFACSLIFFAFAFTILHSEQVLSLCSDGGCPCCSLLSTSWIFVSKWGISLWQSDSLSHFCVWPSSAPRDVCAPRTDNRLEFSSFYCQNLNPEINILTTGISVVLMCLQSTRI